MLGLFLPCYYLTVLAKVSLRQRPAKVQIAMATKAAGFLKRAITKQRMMMAA